MVSACLGLFIALLRLVGACSVVGWKPSSSESQWLAALWVVEGTASTITDCFEGSGNEGTPACSNALEYDSTVLIENLDVRKGGDFNCTTLQVSGFQSSAACGVDPPEKGARATFFICSLQVESCTARLNTEGNIHVGMISGTMSAVTAGPDDCQQGFCLSVDKCGGRGVSDQGVAAWPSLAAACVVLAAMRL
eukprot:CAMPEP_0171067860 /NCGR_PEP_ID=MMETSP0766_2-20121228/8235_1 /TAXON_ID=439317 /ORGANISM="Gambierdiscus australes, Strain CAWD 149" /LENGTH=192 /DNA_ID=CAMNT_0011524125 /DNA_START=38 /DNA_END=616 /DNA_ORIENTATION=+